MDTNTTVAAPLASEKTLAARFLGSSGTARQLAGSARSQKSGASDDTELGRRIAETHESDNLGLAVKPVLQIIDAIFHRANDDFPGHLQKSDISATDEKILYSPASLPDFVEIPARITSAISYEIYIKCSTGVDVHTVVMDILKMIRHYGWESKAVVATVAFAVTFGEFRLCLQLYDSNPLAKSLSLLNQLHELLEHATDLRPKLEALYDVIREIVDVNKKIVMFYDIPRAYFTADSPEILAGISHIPIAVYWTIRSIVVSTTQILALTGMGIDYLTELWELSSLAHKLRNIKEHLMDIIERCNKYIARKQEDEAYEHIVRTFATTHIDNSKPMKVLFTEEPLSLYDCHKKRRVSIDDLRRKVIALFITDIDAELTASPEYAILQQMYTERRQSPTRPESQYEVVWVPVSETWTPERSRVFNGLREQMEWHSVYDPSVLSRVVIRFIKERWGFGKKPMLAVMDHQGRIVHGNAVHMMCIWGSVSYPFTLNREKLLWDEMSWTIDLLADNLEPNMSIWIQEGRYICLYGGEDIDWIRKFTRIAKDVARESGITLELIYAGKSKPKEKATKHIIETIAQEKLSRYLDWNLIWYFWLRLESMWHSKGQLAIRTEHAGPAEKHRDDPIMQGIIAMLSYGSGSQGWAVISRGFSEMVKGSGEHVFRALVEHGRWRGREAEVGFVPALDEHLRKIHLDTPHHCTSLILPATGAMPETVACAECGRLMERLTMFRCCLDS